MWHIPDFSLSIPTILLDIRDVERLAKWPRRAGFATHPSTDNEWPPKRLHYVTRLVVLLRFNPLNLVKIACSLNGSNGLSVFPRIFFTKKCP